MTFKDLNITEPILKAIEEKGYANPTPIQVKAIPAALTGKDILGCAQTGTGKTAAFAIPIIQHLQALKNRDKSIKALILTPTRELALQISECIDDYAKYTQVRHGVIFGGVNQRAQVAAQLQPDRAADDLRHEHHRQSFYRVDPERCRCGATPEEFAASSR